MSNFIRINTEKSTKFVQILRNLQLVPVYTQSAHLVPEECRAAAHSCSTHSRAFVVEYFPTA